MSLEALRTQVDKLNWEKSQLETQNQRLREEHPEEANLDAEAEIAHYKEECERLTGEAVQTEQLIRNLREENDALKRQVQEGTVSTNEESASDQLAQEQSLQEELQQRCARLEAELHSMEQTSELQRLRDLEKERQKWEAREERLVTQLASVQQQREEEILRARDQTRPHYAAILAEREKELNTEGEKELQSPRARREPEAVADSEASPISGPCDMSPSGSRRVQQSSPVSAALLAHQLPPLAKFSGENQEINGETFQDWLEQFKMVAAIGQWDQHAMLVNLATRLRGQAYAFYRSCTSQQRTNYDALVAALSKRFTPVRIKAVQSSLFHERKQEVC